VATTVPPPRRAHREVLRPTAAHPPAEIPAPRRARTDARPALGRAIRVQGRSLAAGAVAERQVALALLFESWQDRSRSARTATSHGKNRRGRRQLLFRSNSIAGRRSESSEWRTSGNCSISAQELTFLTVVLEWADIDGGLQSGTIRRARAARNSATRWVSASRWSVRASSSNAQGAGARGLPGACAGQGSRS